MSNKITETREIEPVIGMGVTMDLGSDRLPGTVREIFQIRGRIAVTCSTDQTKATDPVTYVTRDDGERTTYRRREDGRWVEMVLSRASGRWVKARAPRRIRFGYRDAHMSREF